MKPDPQNSITNPPFIRKPDALNPFLLRELRDVGLLRFVGISSGIAKKETTERNCNYYDRSSIAEREKLQLLRRLQYCRKRQTVITATLLAWQKEKLRALHSFGSQALDWESFA